MQGGFNVANTCHTKARLREDRVNKLTLNSCRRQEFKDTHSLGIASSESGGFFFQRFTHLSDAEAALEICRDYVVDLSEIVRLFAVSEDHRSLVFQ